MAYIYRLFLLVLLILLNWNVKAQSPASSLTSLVDQAIIDFEQTPKKFWSFEVSRYENEEGNITSSIERFEPQPNQNKQWSLIRLNDSEPTQAEIEKFVKSKHKQAKKSKDEKSYSVELRELINLKSLAFQSENETHITMTFNVYLPKLGKDAEGKLDGVLTYHKQDKFIDKITIENNADFSPILSANISNLSIVFDFIKIDESILFSENSMKMKGTFAYFIEIDEVSSDVFSKFQYKPYSIASE